jgi:hypothetical protein
LHKPDSFVVTKGFQIQIACLSQFANGKGLHRQTIRPVPKYGSRGTSVIVCIAEALP